jgi:hypothetical protein
MRFTYSSGDRPLEGYTVKRGIGRGGFGEVYEAISDGGKEVALKLVQRNLDIELRGVTQCLNLKHPNLVGLYDVKQAANGDYWVVMEYVAGDTLDRVVADHPQGLPPVEALSWMRGVGEALGYLHERGIVHRDLKPGNIFRESGVVKVGDYGLSKFVSASRRSGQTGSVGTVHYMAPEVARGRYGKEVDLYAAGIMLYEMLTGRVPFEGASPGEILMKHLTATPDLQVLPPAFRPVVGRLLEKDPARRYSSFAAMLADLDGYLASPPAEEEGTAQAAPAYPAPEAAPRAPVAVAVQLPAECETPGRGSKVMMAVFLAMFWTAGVCLLLMSKLSAGTTVDPTVFLVSGVGILTFSVLLPALLFIHQLGRRRQQVRSLLPPAHRVRETAWAEPMTDRRRRDIGMYFGLGCGFLVGGLIFMNTHEMTAILIGIGAGLLGSGFAHFFLRRPNLTADRPASETPPVSNVTMTGRELARTGPWSRHGDED